ncbi:hypothetical protein EIZ48_04915 [Photobacterium alginatilyticum]|uniref:Uncharacterized protein n=1 Tax=Photobacterium alginatilyticum TaxID=1775171 RepID=A0ABW9YE30_9GAMM|nr:hypothetical protein [Photobacterium alginatilyticum]
MPRYCPVPATTYRHAFWLRCHDKRSGLLDTLYHRRSSTGSCRTLPKGIDSGHHCYCCSGFQARSLRSR